MAKSPPRRSLYGVPPSVKMMADWLAGLKEKTGHSLEEWAALARKAGPRDVNAGREWFMSHGFTTMPAWHLADYVWGSGVLEASPEEYLAQAEIYVRDMYAGPKEHLKPLHDAILAAARELGDDVRACPCKTIVPFYRQHVFAEIKPATRTRIDLSFALRKHKGRIPSRLVDTRKPPSDRLSHKVPIAQLSDVDAEVKRWLRTAYELDG